MNRQAPWAGLRRSALIDQQLWYLGRDIAGPGGNALLRYGFERRRSPDGTGSTAYLFPLADDSPPTDRATEKRLVCWGFGIYAGTVMHGHADAERTVSKAPAWAGVCIERFRDTPGLVRSPVRSTLHQVADLPQAVSPLTDDDHAFAAGAMRGIARTFMDYERWVIATIGSSHRHAALRDAPRHKRHRFAQVAELSTHWEQVALGAHPPATTAAAWAGSRHDEISQVS